MTKFSRSQYQEIAEILKEAGEGVDNAPQAGYAKQHQLTVRLFAQRLLELNPNFKPHLFYKACDCEE